MKIKKTFQGTLPENKILNTQNDSQTDTYSCDYINGIVESGSNANGNWIKWADGTMICTIKKLINKTNITLSAWGSLYYTDIFDFTWVQPFTQLDNVIITGDVNQYLYMMNEPTITGLSSIRLVRVDANPQSVNLSITAIGKWK